MNQSYARGTNQPIVNYWQVIVEVQLRSRIKNFTSKSQPAITINQQIDSN